MIEIVVWLSAYSSCIEMIVAGFDFVPLSLLCRGNCWSLALCLASCVEVVVLESGVVHSKFVITNSLVKVPCVGGPVWT